VFPTSIGEYNVLFWESGICCVDEGWTVFFRKIEVKENILENSPSSSTGNDRVTAKTLLWGRDEQQDTSY